MTDLIYASRVDRLLVLRKMFEFWPGRTGTSVRCTQCDAWFYAKHEKVRNVFLCTLELVNHADEHPSF